MRVASTAGKKAEKTGAQQKGNLKRWWTASKFPVLFFFFLVMSSEAARSGAFLLY